ncbi:MAG: MFS transporter [Acidimicrobiales bacterium]|jgi:EmrB/QacA subfamily drug resistance transporter
MSDSPLDVTSTNRHAPDWLILCIACIAQFMVVLDVSIVNVALPRMGHDLHFTQSSAQWVVNAYVLTFAGFLLLGGRACDFFGRRRVYITGIILFTLASIGAGVAQTGTQMITIRAVQGIGGAILSPATLTIIVTTFHGPRLPKAIGAWSAVAGAGGAVGGLLGGILTGWASWRWVFFINVPFGLVAGIVAAMYLREMRNRGATTKLDVTGSVLVTGGLASTIYAVVNTTTHAWTSSTTLEWLFLGLALLAAFIFWEAKVASHPLVPFSIFRSRPLTTANLMMFLIGGTFFAMWYFLTYYFQGVLGYGPVKAGFAFFPMALAIIIGAQISSRLLSRTGVRPLLQIGAVLATLGFLWISLIKPADSYAGHILVPSFICAFAMGLLFAPLATAATSGVDRADAGLASGLLNTARQVGGSLSLAILATIATDVTNHDRANALLASAYTSGYDRVFQISACVTVVAFFVSFALPRNTGRTVVASAPTTPQVSPSLPVEPA